MSQLQHLALIMDGNGRWAERNQLPRSEGHKRGAQVVKTIVKHARSCNIPHLTLFAFSSLNWGRPTEEVTALMELLRSFLETEEADLITQEIRLRAIGEREMLPSSLQELLEKVEMSTSGGQAMTLSLAVSYDGRRDLVRATQRLVALAQRGQLLAADVGEEILMQHLSTAHQPEVDLVIRTSGERRLSGFLPIEACYAELIFLEKMWPDFTSHDLDVALEEYTCRQRRFGLISTQVDLQCSPA